MSESTGTGVDNAAVSGLAGERRWPMAAAVLTAVILQVVTPHAGRVPGWWLFPVLEVILLGILTAQDPGRIDRRSRGLQRLMIALLAVMATGTALAVSCWCTTSSAA